MSGVPSILGSSLTFIIAGRCTSVVTKTTFLIRFSSKNLKKAFLSFTKVLFVLLSVAQLSQPRILSKQSGRVTGVEEDIIFHVAFEFKRFCFNQPNCSLPKSVLLFWGISARSFRLR